MDATARIKNLSIALEALYQGHYWSECSRVQDLLAHEINELKKEQATAFPPARPAKPESQFNPYTNNDEEIPF